MIASMVMVVEAFVATPAIAHQERTGICAPSNCVPTLRIADTSLSTRAKLWTRAMLPSASVVRSAWSV